MITATKRGLTARLLSHVRPLPMVIVGTENQETSRQLSFSWGLKPVVLNPFPVSSIELQDRLMMYKKEAKIAKKGQKIIVVSGEPVGLSEHVSAVEVHTI